MIDRATVQARIEKRGIFLLDGGLATELEANGHALTTALWSADLLKSQPGAIRAVHDAYLKAGADCIATASYQASFTGCARLGIDRAECERLLRLSVALACEARDAYAKGKSGDQPLVAASIGPYGAYLANGAEYTGDYGISAEALREFHADRLALFAATNADLLAFETIPSFGEAEMLIELLQKTPDARAWLSFSCKDGRHISDGTSIELCAALAAECDQLVAVGVNCTPPAHLLSLIERIANAAPDLPIAVYPNSGETWDAGSKTWHGERDPQEFSDAAKRWYRAGARVIGGCCRTGPSHIRAVGEALSYTA